MADDVVSYYPAFPEASPVKSRIVFTRGLAAASGNAVRTLTDGHAFTVLRGARRIRQRLRALADGYDTYDRVVRGLLRTSPGGLTVRELVDAIGAVPSARACPR